MQINLLINALSLNTQCTKSISHLTPRDKLIKRKYIKSRYFVSWVCRNKQSCLLGDVCNVQTRCLEMDLVDKILNTTFLTKRIHLIFLQTLSTGGMPNHQVDRCIPI